MGSDNIGANVFTITVDDGNGGTDSATLNITVDPRTITLVEEHFGGAGAALNGTSADVFDPVLTTAGGSDIWATGGAFLDNGTVSVDGREIYTAEDLKVGLFTSTDNF